MPEWAGHVRPRLSALHLSPEREAEIVEELSQHLDDRWREFIAGGASPDEAARLALADFREEHLLARYMAPLRQAHLPPQITPGAPRGHFFSDLRDDLRYGLRQLLHSPGFTAVAIATLALGVGVNAAIFSLVNAVLLKPLPYPRPEQIVSVSERLPGGANNLISTMNFLDWERQNRCFQFLSAIAADTVTLTGSDHPEELKVYRVSTSYFKVLGVDAGLGRTFGKTENEAGNDLEAVLSNRIWLTRFGGDPGVIGRKIMLDAQNYTIVGVLPANVALDRGWAALWLPLAFSPANRTRNYHWLSAIARLDPGVTLTQARGQMDAIEARIAALYPDSNKGWGVTVDPYIDQVVQPELRRSLWVLLAAVGAVLLIACANIANLTLARGSKREQEIAIRFALGASRFRLIRQLLTESIILGLLGGVAGFALGNGFLRGMKLGLPSDMLPAHANIRMDSGVLLFTMGMGILTGILFGLMPAISGTRPDLARPLKESGRTTAGLALRHMRTALVIAEVARSFVLLAGAGLLIRSFNRLASLDPGVDTTNVLAMDLPPLAQFTNSTALTNYLRDVALKIESVPGVRSAAITDKPPMEGYANGAPFLIEGREQLPYARRPVCGFKVVGPSYFDTVGMKLLRGRSLAESDLAGAAPVTVINETMAKTYFQGEDPIGKRILIRQLVFGQAARGQEIPWTVVGIIKDEKVGGKFFRFGQDFPVVYVTFYQSPYARNSVVVRAAMDPLLLSRSIEQAIWQVNKSQAVANIETLEEIKSQSVAPARLRTALLAIFAGIALLLAAVGIYGVVSYSVAQRAHEMAIRSALGASRADLLHLVVGKTMLIVLTGLALGVAAALALTRVLASLLYESGPADRLMWVAAAALLASVALLACYFPARRAARLDPIAVLRAE